MRLRLDQAMVQRGLVSTRSQAESWIRLGKVQVNGRMQTKPSAFVAPDSVITFEPAEQYVSRAGLKLASVAQALDINFSNATVLDVGSSTGGFTDYALQHGAKKVIAVEAGSHQLHHNLRGHPAIELHEQTDIRDVQELSSVPTIVVIDVSFVSLRDILPHVTTLSGKQTQIIAMVKPQFEAAASNLKHKGVIKNDHLRREILKEFETWAKKYFIIAAKADSEVTGSRGNLERFYILQKVLKG